MRKIYFIPMTQTGESAAGIAYNLEYDVFYMLSGASLIDDVAALRGLPGEFSSALSRTAARVARSPESAEREDLRKLRFVTIDGSDARDFDDAVYCSQLSGGGFQLWVAIADVSAFVHHNSPLDVEARRRGNSVYLPDRVLPMLPPALSNGECSLNPDEDKLCLACEMKIIGGEIKSYRFTRAVMRSQRRLTYEEAASDIQRGAHHLRALAKVGRVLRQERQARGAFMMERPEIHVALSPNGAPELQTSVRNEAHLLIEECMIAANRCAADFVIRRRLPALHRIHKKPSGDNVKALRAILSQLGVAFPARPAARDFSIALEQIAAKDANLADCLLPVLLGTLARAEYAPNEKTGHFGLSCSRYLHWTSPIRRYPDLLTHRAIIAGLCGQKAKMPDLRATGEHCSQTETIADKAGWDCRQRLLCWRAQEWTGREFEVMVSGAASFGLFLTSPELGIDGLLRLSSLPGYWQHDPDLRRIVCRNNGNVIGLGDRMRARLTSVVPEKGRADFELVVLHEQ